MWICPIKKAPERKNGRGDRTKRIFKKVEKWQKGIELPWDVTFEKSYLRSPLSRYHRAKLQNSKTNFFRNLQSKADAKLLQLSKTKQGSGPAWNQGARAPNAQIQAQNLLLTPKISLSSPVYSKAHGSRSSAEVRGFCSRPVLQGLWRRFGKSSRSQNGLARYYPTIYKFQNPKSTNNFSSRSTSTSLKISK